MLVGAALAMLFTPKSGPELREYIRDFVDKEIDRTRCRCNDNVE